MVPCSGAHFQNPPPTPAAERSSPVSIFPLIRNVLSLLRG